MGARVANGSGNRAAAILVGRHAELRGGALVEAAAGAVSRVVHGAGDVVPGLQVAFEQAQTAGVGVFPGRDSHGCLEAPLQMEWALVKGFAQALQSDGLVEMLFDVAANLLDSV